MKLLFFKNQLKILNKSILSLFDGNNNCFGSGRIAKISFTL